MGRPSSTWLWVCRTSTQLPLAVPPCLHGALRCPPHHMVLTLPAVCTAPPRPPLQAVAELGPDQAHDFLEALTLVSMPASAQGS